MLGILPLWTLYYYAFDSSNYTLNPISSSRWNSIEIVEFLRHCDLLTMISFVMTKGTSNGNELFYNLKGIPALLLGTKQKCTQVELGSHLDQELFVLKSVLITGAVKLHRCRVHSCASNIFRFSWALRKKRILKIEQKWKELGTILSLRTQSLAASTTPESLGYYKYSRVSNKITCMFIKFCVIFPPVCFYQDQYV